MAQLKNMAILLVVVVAAAILQSTEAANHTVGGSTGWISSPPGGASFYSNWASNITFKENDTLVFNFTSGHTVTVVTKTSFDTCNTNQTIQVFTTSPVRYTLNRTGEFYFICSVPGHCNSGQKLSVNVTGSSSPSPPPPPPAQGPSPPAPGTSRSPPSSGATPPTSPSDQGATPPPSPSGSAASLAATFSLLIITVVLNFLF